MDTKNKFKLQIKKDEEKSSLEIEGVVEKDMIQDIKDEVLKMMSKNKKIDGFRDGNAPIGLIEKSVDPLEVWKQSAQEVIIKNFPEMVAGEKLVPIGSPKLELTKIAVGSDVSFKLNFFVMPKIELPDYKALIKEVEKPKKPEGATDSEIKQVTIDLRRSFYKKSHPEKEIPKDENELPELTDQFIQEISGKYKDVEGFKLGVKESITKEKQIQSRDEFRQRILDKLIDNTNFVIPEVIIERRNKTIFFEIRKPSETIREPLLTIMLSLKV